ncbi:DsbA family oxidoreductase [Clostridium saccharoperbutylacetonicum]|uniref:DsbA family oxidoreductase n=1 Tax=Clostridium saccharoperbutylacetonicum TaxID=36745 RepID=UPI0039EBA2A6
MKVEIWFDFVCPFCYMGERKFERALAAFEHKDEVEIIFKSFQLNMSQKDVKGKDIHQVIADKYNITYEEAKANNDTITKAAAEVGLNYRFDILKLNNTQLAHEISKYAESVGKGKEVVDFYFKGYFEEGLDIGNEEKLLELAEKAGLDISDLKKQLAGESLKAKVKEDEALARKLGVSSVPYFVFDNKYAVSGAQEPEQFLKALNQAYNN